MAAPLDYLVLGHVTLDRQPDGGVLPGGTALFSGLQAARLGLRTGVVTTGRPADLDAALAPYRREMAVELRPAAGTSVFENVGVGPARRQTLHEWGGPIALTDLPDARIVHLGPVAREIDPAALPPLPPGVFLGVTPQGWLRHWGDDRRIREGDLHLPAPLAARLDALVVSETEAPLARAAIAAVRAHGGLVAVTRGMDGCTVLTPDGDCGVPALSVPLVDDTGAGDVFAAAWFAALAEGREPVAAARFAHAAAGLSIGGRGVAAIPTRAAIARALQRQDRDIDRPLEMHDE